MTRGSRWESVQALRFLAAFGVLLFHTREIERIGRDEAGWFQAVSLLGFTGVDIFFVISGFILWSTARRDGRRPPVGPYLLKRSARIFTGYWPFFFLALVLFWILDPAHLEGIDFFGSWWLIPGPLDRLLIPVSWTLSFELYFYCFFALLLFLEERAAVRILWVAFALVVGANLYFTLILGLYSPSGWRGAPRLYTFFLSPFCLEFLAGALIARYGRSLPRAPINRWLLSLCILTLYGVGYGYQTSGTLLGPGMIGAYHYPERVLLFGTAAVLLVYLAWDLERSGVYRPWPWLVSLGDASYSLYLSHTLLLYLFVRTLPLGEFQALRVPLFVTLILCILAYSVGHFQWIERPLYAWAKAGIHRRFGG